MCMVGLFIVFQFVLESEFFKIPTASIHQVTALICKANKPISVNQSHHLMKIGNKFEFHISLQTLYSYMFH